MTLHDYGYLPPGFLELSCFGVIFSNIPPASESGFLPGIFLRESTVRQISFVMLIFRLFSIVFKPIVSGERGKFSRQIA